MKGGSGKDCYTPFGYKERITNLTSAFSIFVGGRGDCRPELPPIWGQSNKFTFNAEEKPDDEGWL